MAIIAFDDMVGSLRVEEIGDDQFTAPNIPMAYSRVFGGQLLAQCIAVAAATAPGKRVKSIHASFPREGDLAERIVYSVDRIHDGRSFAGRAIEGAQGERRIAAAHVSLHVEEPGLEHGLDGPDVPPPDDCAPVELSMIPWQTRVVGRVDLTDRAEGPPRYAFWMRAPAPGDDPAVHQALLAHATDLTLIGTVLRPHAGLSEADSPDRIRTAVTTHTVWFHSPLRVDDWLLVDQQSPRAFGARGFGLGHVFDRGGALVASFAQECLIAPLAPRG